jgi:hypothetical protein
VWVGHPTTLKIRLIGFFTGKKYVGKTGAQATHTVAVPSEVKRGVILSSTVCLLSVLNRSYLA